ncbi:hypothetical protein JCM19235_2576 [Vibrio maritimus]|uniref:Uncharacterized protein n=2 Tax=Vibrio TaxID=662 RepID=A0A090RX59_9VIBR|nr:hypothetical protein JCM19235_2576 [Vibrio maritimus]GAL28872.1 hypothetical protein JCM19239_6496 [Vibrio variabilis]
MENANSAAVEEGVLILIMGISPNKKDPINTAQTVPVWY